MGLASLIAWEHGYGSKRRGIFCQMVMPSEFSCFLERIGITLTLRNAAQGIKRRERTVGRVRIGTRPVKAAVLIHKSCNIPHVKYDA